MNYPFELRTLESLQWVLLFTMSTVEVSSINPTFSSNWSTQNTYIQNDLSIRSKYSTEDIIALICMSTINIIGVVANMGILIVILKTPHLRVQLTYWFVLNLCIIDLSACLTILPFAIVSFAYSNWLFGSVFCYINAFLSSLFTFASIVSICAISVERYYVIKAPMHYSANMTWQRTITAIAYIWIHCSLFAIFPLIGWNSYEYRKHKAHCSFTWDVQGSHRYYIIAINFFCFALPLAIIASMYCAIFRVARRAATQVSPAELMPSTIPHLIIPSCVSPNVQTSNSAPPPSGSNNHETPLPNGSPCEYTPGNGGSRITVQSDRRHASRWKAVKTLAFIILIFILLLSPQFILHFYGVIRGEIPDAPRWEIVTTWLGLATFAVNPFLYGWLNRTIRDALQTLVEDIKYCLFERDSADDNARAGEDFFQFLERTSTTRAQSIPNSKIQLGESRNVRIMEEPESSDHIAP